MANNIGLDGSYSEEYGSHLVNILEKLGVPHKMNDNQIILEKRSFIKIAILIIT